MEPRKFFTDRELEGTHRVMYGVEVRCQPEDHPRAFVAERGRWGLVAYNVRLALGCIPRQDRGLYAHLAKGLAYAIYRRDRSTAEELGGPVRCAESQSPLHFGG